MWTHNNAPIFDTDPSDSSITPNQNWNTLLNHAREFVDKPCEKLGYFVASIAAQFGEFADLSGVERAFRDAAEPPMSPTEKRQFTNAFHRVWSLEDAFVVTAMDARMLRKEGVS